MESLIDERIIWTSADLSFFPKNGNRYEIIDGELYVTRAPHYRHQHTCGRLYAALNTWSLSTNLGETLLEVGLIFSDSDNVTPDVAWISNQRLDILVDSGGHFNGAPELIIEVMSESLENEARDRSTKLKLYSKQGVQEYWIVNWQLQELSVYRRHNLTLSLVNTFFSSDRLTSPLLPGFELIISSLFA